MSTELLANYQTSTSAESSSSSTLSDDGLTIMDTYPLPSGSSSYNFMMSSSSSSASPTDLFDGELGDYELNEIPSLFGLDSHQQMSADLAAFGFSVSDPSCSCGEGQGDPNPDPGTSAATSTTCTTNNNNNNNGPATGAEMNHQGHHNGGDMLPSFVVNNTTTTNHGHQHQSHHQSSFSSSAQVSLAATDESEDESTATDNTNANHHHHHHHQQQEQAPSLPTRTTAAATAISQKRTAAEISEDESSSASPKTTAAAAAAKKKKNVRSMNKTRRLMAARGGARRVSVAATTGATSKKKTAAVAPIASAPSLLAPKPPPTDLSPSLLLAPAPATAPRSERGTTTRSATPTSSSSSSSSSSGMDLGGGNDNGSNTTTVVAVGGAATGRPVIDTSTAHVMALTGSKGAAMCFEVLAGTTQDNTIAIPLLAPTAAVSNDWTPEQKAKFSRDRNRLHARNTRIRKKAYVDELKQTLEVLVQERDRGLAAQREKLQFEMEERGVRFSVMEEFLRLRGSNEQQEPGRWTAILEESATLGLPALDYYYNYYGGKGSSSPTRNVVSGLQEIMEECNGFARMVQYHGNNRKTPTKMAAVAPGVLVFQCDRNSLLMEGCNAVIDWSATSTDPEKMDFSLHGTFRAVFNPQSNRLHSIDLFFDSSPLFTSK